MSTVFDINKRKVFNFSFKIISRFEIKRFKIFCIYEKTQKTNFFLDKARYDIDEINEDLDKCRNPDKLNRNLDFKKVNLFFTKPNKFKKEANYFFKLFKIGKIK